MYFVGLPEEVDSTFLGRPHSSHYKQAVKWPAGRRGQLAVPGNHEYYSAGNGYYRNLLSEMWVNDKHNKQLASYFALSHANWLLIALDTGYGSYKAWPSVDHFSRSVNFDTAEIELPAVQVQWLSALLRDPRHRSKGLVFLSHHQVTSAFEKSSYTTRFQQQVIDCIGNRQRRVVWLYGHEHRLSLYDGEQQTVALKDNAELQLRAYHRCCGNSGFPCEVAPLPAEVRRTHLEYYDDRVYLVEVEGLLSVPLGFNGFVSMIIQDSGQLTLNYATVRLDDSSNLTSLDPNTLFSETFTVNSAGSVNRVEAALNSDLNHDGLTLVVHVPKRTQSVPSGSCSAVTTTLCSASAPPARPLHS